MTTQPEPLPFFERAPVIETVIGIQFEPIHSLTTSVLGDFCRTLGNNWRSPSVKKALGPLLERFPGESEHSWGERVIRSKIRTFQPDPVRLMVHNQDGSRLLQIENAWIAYNWMRSPDEDYPRFDSVEQEFIAQLNKLRKFVNDVEPSSPLAIKMWEVAYVNHIPAGQLWNTVADWPNVCPGLLGKDTVSAKRGVENVDGKWRIAIGNRAILTIELGQGVQEESKAPVMVLKIAARGQVSQEHDLTAGINLGHQTIVRTFAELTSESAHLEWGRES